MEIIYNADSDGKVVVAGREYRLSQGVGPERLVYMPKPTAVYYFVDRLKAVVRLTPDQIASLRQHSDDESRFKELLGKRGSRHEIVLFQPKREAIELLDGLAGVKLESFEPSRDAIFGDALEHSLAWRWRLQHGVRRYKSRQDRCELGTTFTDASGRRCRPRGSMNSWKPVIAIELASVFYDGFARKSKGWTVRCYKDRASKLTGEFHCLHEERVVTGRRAIIGSGLNRIGDLNRQSWFRQFWQERDQFRALNVEAFGRALNSADTGERRHRAWIVDIDGRDFNVDAARGRLAFQEAGGCLQKLIDEHRDLRVSRFLSVLDTDGLFRGEFVKTAPVSLGST